METGPYRPIGRGYIFGLLAIGLAVALFVLNELEIDVDVLVFAVLSGLALYSYIVGHQAGERRTDIRWWRAQHGYLGDED